MPRTMLTNITSKAAQAVFTEMQATAPNVWQKHCQIIPSDTQEEVHSWIGYLPIPREFISGRSIQGVRDFTMTLANGEYEMSVLFDRKTVEDDRHGQIPRALRLVAERYAQFKDFLFAAMLVDGENSTATFDGTAFHAATRAIGSSANVDNLSTAAVTLNTDPSATEVLTALKEILESMARYQDDQGQFGYNSKAQQEVRCVIPPEFEKAFTEAIASSVISNSSNPWGQNLVEYDVLSELVTSDVAFYTSLVGAERKPFILQQRVPLEVIVYSDANDIALRNGLLMLSRERFAFGYGEMRRSFRYDFTTTG